MNSKNVVSDNGVSGQVALITGGSRGIGHGIAKRFLAEGMTVVIADRDAKTGRAAEAELKTSGNCLFIRMDISKESQVRHGIREVVRRFGHLNVLINNAGIANPVSELEVKRWHEIIAVNLTGAFLCAKYAVSSLKKTRGSIINMASTRAIMSEPNTEAYSASKGGLLALTHSLAISLGPAIRVNCISPGWIDTGQSPVRPKDNREHPAGRVGRPADVAALAFFLISADAEFITGQNYVIDGGMTKKMIY
jgi:NAD(P)-dependent dehydrogenase (short-subunit alcohol dehydrogenase family)